VPWSVGFTPAVHGGTLSLIQVAYLPIDALSTSLLITPVFRNSQLRSRYCRALKNPGEAPIRASLAANRHTSRKAEIPLHSLPMSRATITDTAESSREIVSDPTPLGIDPDSTFSEEIPVYNHTVTGSVKPHLQYYDENKENNITLGNIEQKANAAVEVMQKTQAVLVEVEPWFVNMHMGTDEFDRWEPFFVAFPEVATDQQMKFTNLAPLLEVAYRISQRDTHLDNAESSDLQYDDDADEYPAIVKAQMEEQKAFTRYGLDSFYNGEENDDGETNGAWVDMSPIHAIHTCLKPFQQHLIIGGRDDGSMYCGRGALFDKHVDVAIDLDRKKNQHGERKVAVYNDKSRKDAMNSLDFNETHARYLGEKARWEVDMDAIETVVRDLLAHEDINYVSLHRSTEKAYVTHLNPAFRDAIEGYPAFEE